jgi:hypothetical protein
MGTEKYFIGILMAWRSLLVLLRYDSTALMKAKVGKHATKFIPHGF